VAIFVEDLEIDRSCDWPGPADAGHWTWRTGTPDANDPDPDTGEPRPPLVDLTGYTAVLKIRVSPSSTTALLTLTQADGITLGGTAGTIAVAITAARAAALPVGTLAYDTVLTTPGGQKIKFNRGAVKVRETSARA
jgi:hypothetical protein